MATAKPSKTDLMYEIDYNPKFVPSHSPKANVKTNIIHGKPNYLMKNHLTGTYYDLDEPTNLVWDLIDGKRTVKKIVSDVRQQRPDVREQAVIETLLFFAEAELLMSSFEQAPKKRFRVASPFEIDFTLIWKSNNFFQSLHRRISLIFKRHLLWAVAILIIVSGAFFAGEFVSIYGNKANFEILGSSVVGFFFYYFIALAPVIAIHEMAHAVTLVHYGGQAGEIGTGLFYFGPMFYAETTDAWSFRRRHRIMVYLAGNLSTLLIGSVLVILHLTLRIPDPASHILVMVAFYCFTMSLFNFAPPFETDGYYMLSDVVNMPNLRRDSYGYLGSIIKKALGKKTKTGISGLTVRKKRIFILYAILSVTWIAYIVFQSSLFLVYMGQDVVSVVANILQSLLSSQALQMSVIVIASASILYFGMQIVGYGYVFSAAIKRMTSIPLKVEAIHDRDLAVFAYLPPYAPESLSNSLEKKMEKAAKKFTSTYETRKIGRSCIAVLRMGGTNLATAQIREHLRHVENHFSAAYQKLILSQKETLRKSVGAHAPYKNTLTTTFEQVAAHCAEAGNPSAIPIARTFEKKQYETMLYLLLSAFGTVWTVEVQPAQVYDMQRELIPSLLMEDMTLTDLYGDVENFKRSTIFGYDSLAKLSADTETGLSKCLARPDRYQLISSFEPVKGRIVLAGRTEQVESKIDIFANLFVAYTLSGYLDNLLSETCLKFSAINRTVLPDITGIREMNSAEIATLYEDLTAFMANKKLVDESIEESESNVYKIRQNLRQMKKALTDTENYKVGMIGDIMNINVENLDALPARIAEFKKGWKSAYGRVEKLKDHVEKEYARRSPATAKKKSETLRIFPIILALSVALGILGAQPSVTNWWIEFLFIALALQGFYWLGCYRRWKSLHKVTKYPNEAFGRVNTLILALTEAVYGYVANADVLKPI